MKTHYLDDRIIITRNGTALYGFKIKGGMVICGKLRMRNAEGVVILPDHHLQKHSMNITVNTNDTDYTNRIS